MATQPPAPRPRGCWMRPESAASALISPSRVLAGRSFSEIGMHPGRTSQYVGRVASWTGRCPKPVHSRDQLMTPGASKIAARDLGTLFRLGTIGGLTDAQLLDRFLAQPGEEAEVAFAAVVERHGPMVLRVCRRILSDPHDAEDAFQVTFLVLARKARSIARRGLLANWLHGVAVRTAKEVRKNAARRRHREEKMKARLRVDRPADDRDDELRAALDEELSRLPDSFRAAVVLCDLEGKSHQEAACLIGVPVGTVSSRLVRARSLLRDRLTRRGLDPTAADPSRDSAPMTVPPALLAATSRAAARVAIEGTLAGAVPAHLATIARRSAQDHGARQAHCKRGHPRDDPLPLDRCGRGRGRLSRPARGRTGALRRRCDRPIENGRGWTTCRTPTRPPRNGSSDAPAPPRRTSRRSIASSSTTTSRPSTAAWRSPARRRSTSASSPAAPSTGKTGRCDMTTSPSGKLDPDGRKFHLQEAEGVSASSDRGTCWLTPSRTRSMGSG